MNLEQLEELLRDYQLNGPCKAEQEEFGEEENFRWFKERTAKEIPKEAQDDALDHGMDYADGAFRIGFFCGCREMERRLMAVSPSVQKFLLREIELLVLRSEECSRGGKVGFPIEIAETIAKLACAMQPYVFPYQGGKRQ